MIYRIEIARPESALVTCSIDRTKTSPIAQEFFSVGLVSGEVRIKDPRKIDHEAGKSFKIYFTLKSYSPLLTGQFNSFELVVKIQDVNDNSPIFNAVSYTFSVFENVTVNSVIGSVLATDADGDIANNQVRYYMAGDLLKQVFIVNRTNGEVSLLTSLDYEEKTEYIMTLCATDNATDINEFSPKNEKRVTCVPVIVNVMNINDNAVKFDKSSYTVQISEISPNGLEVFTFTATDLDKTPAYYQYNLVKTPSSDMAAFKLNNLTGEVLLAARKLDFEVQPTYKLYVEAVDSDSMKVGDEAKLIINLIDMNDNSPVFSQNFFSVSVIESALIGTVLTTLTASDKDGISQGKMKYFISTNQYSDSFSVNPTSGTIKIAKALDFNTYKLMMITVCANDSTVDKRHTFQGKCFILFSKISFTE